ncbi:hypothetical protein ACFQFR_00510 [Streptomyces goshikiensis]
MVLLPGIPGSRRSDIATVQEIVTVTVPTSPRGTASPEASTFVDDDAQRMPWSSRERAAAAAASAWAPL